MDSVDSIGRQRPDGRWATDLAYNQERCQLPRLRAVNSPASLALPFLLALLLKRQDLQLAGVLGMGASVGCPVRVTETLLQLGRLLMQADRSRVRRQLPALGERSSLTSAGRVLAGPAWPHPLLGWLP